MRRANAIRTVWSIMPAESATGSARVMVRASAADMPDQPGRFALTATVADGVTFMEACDAAGAVDLLKRLPGVGPEPPDDATTLDARAADLVLACGGDTGRAVAWILVLEGGGLRSGVDPDLTDEEMGLAVLLMDRMGRVLAQAMDAFMPHTADTKWKAQVGGRQS